MEQAFHKAFKLLIGHEGGYSNDSRDPGGETKFGISKRSYPNVNIRDLTLDQAKAIYYRDFWKASGANLHRWPMSYFIFDYAVNSGVSRATQQLQVYPTPGRYLASRIRFFTYLNDTSWRAFGKGWMRRMAELVQMTDELQPVQESPRLVFLNGKQLNVSKATVVDGKWYIKTEDV